MQMQGPNGILVRVRAVTLHFPSGTERTIPGDRVIGFEPQNMTIAAKHETDPEVMVHFAGIPFSVELEPSAIHAGGPGILRG